MPRFRCPGERVGPEDDGLVLAQVKCEAILREKSRDFRVTGSGRYLQCRSPCSEHDEKHKAVRQCHHVKWSEAIPIPNLSFYRYFSRLLEGTEAKVFITGRLSTVPLRLAARPEQARSTPTHSHHSNNLLQPCDTKSTHSSNSSIHSSIVILSLVSSHH